MNLSQDGDLNPPDDIDWGLNITAPWTAEQVRNLNRFQQFSGTHGFTCNCSPRNNLIATANGWECPRNACGHEQGWAPAYMADADFFHRLRPDFTARQEVEAKVRTALGELDGTRLAAVALLAGLTRDDIAELGGVSEADL